MAGAALGIALTLLPQLPQLVAGVGGLVHAVESVFGKGNGAVKKQAALTAFADLFNLYQTAQPLVPGAKPINSSELNDAIGKIIDGVVELAHATGQFVHSTPAA